MYKTYTLTIDVTSQKEPPLVYFNQEDYNTAQLIVHLRNGSNILPLSGTSVEIVVQKLDNNGGKLPCTITDANNGIIEVVLSSSSLAYPGQVMCEIHITKGENKLVTPRFKYVVGKSLLNPETLSSTNEYPFLQQLVVDGKNAKKDFDNALIGVDKKTNEAVAAANTKFSTALTTIVENAEKESVKAQSQLNSIVKDAQKVVDDAKQIDMPFLKKSEDEMKGLRKDVGDTNKRMDNIVANGNKDNTEVVDARLGADGIARGSVGSLVREIHKQQLSDERKSQLLQQGLNILNAPVASPLSLEIQGRTLVNLLGQTNLDNTKYYVFVPNKGTTKITYGGNTYEGVTKFTGQATVSYLIKQDFRGKVAGSVVDNGNIAKGNAVSNALQTPSGNWDENVQANYDRTSSLDGNLRVSASNPVSGVIAQQLFSFDIIRTLQDKFGPQIWQGKTTLVEKVAIAKQIITKITCIWRGFGSSSSGNKATLKWYSDAWWGNNFHTSNGVNRLIQNNSGTNITSLTASVIQNDGFANYLVYAEPSDGTVSSVINTDYVELELEVNTNLPLLEDALYEVDQATYNKINVDPEYSGQKLLDKFLYVQGVQHLNPVVTVEGGNLLPPFTEWQTIHKNNTILSPYKIEVNPDGNYQACRHRVSIIPGLKYTLQRDTKEGVMYASFYNEKNEMIFGGLLNPNEKVKTFVAPINSIYVLVSWDNGPNATTRMSLENPMLYLGDALKPFVPRNPSYLYTNTVLAGRNGVNDVLYQEDGQWKVLRKWERDIVLDGNANWDSAVADFNSYKMVKALKVSSSKALNAILLKNDTTPLTYASASVASNRFDFDSNGNLYISVSDIDTGFGETYNPVADEVKAYFNGWKVKTSDANGKPIAWKSVVDDKDAPTQTLAYVKANRAPNYTPYKLTYQLATPRVEIVQVEGDFAVSGTTQVTVDSGVVVREKVTPVKQIEASGSFYQINRNGLPNSFTKKRLLKFLTVYKNGVIDSKWNFVITSSVDNGLVKATILENDFDPTAEYTVTYLVQDKHLFTINAVDVKATYNQSIRSTVDEVTVKQSDAATSISILQNIMTDVLARLKANSL
ncbi:BppU family phage baseplate upper protein [Bacillus cereus group sp. BY25LC]|uniref:BppU family phage baseplate upper protein n=1 Tax=Bacillus cereus group sp. BY25LC TaxID=3018080 RepID=UPI0022E0653B|nr:BppU family phage baseplate upper protein [Bacillus cereus group sp. BY25LC]MDA1828533.1 BppU family phage baseplate upper protein [Bacillus cereus group sp. BY25LC]